MKIVQSIKDNPLVSIATAFILVMTTITGTLTATGQLDRLVMTQAEHEADFVPLAENVEEIRNWQKCDRLERRIADLEDRKWKYEQAEDPDEDLIRDIETDIEDVQRDYDALDCARVLAA